MSDSGPFSRARFDVWPRPARPADYERASEELERALSDLLGLVAIYRTGSVSVPGISDLDYIAVVDDRGSLPSIWPALTEQTRYLAMHAPFLVDVETFRRHRWFAHLEPLTLSTAHPVDVEPQPVSDYGDLLLGAESLVVNLMRTLKMSFTGRIKVRPALCELNTVRYGLILAGLRESDAPGAWALDREVRALRQTWFEPGEERFREDRLRGLLERSLPALREALEGLANRVASLDGAPARPLPLSKPWSSVTLVPAVPQDPGRARTARLRSVAARSGRLSELRWRGGRSRLVAVPPAVVSLLQGTASSDIAEFRAARAELVRRYARFLAANGRGYSGIGLAPAFLPR